MDVLRILAGLVVGGLFAALVRVAGPDDAPIASLDGGRSGTSAETDRGDIDLAASSEPREANGAARASRARHDATLPVDADFGVVLVGRVVDTDGRPIDEARVTLSRAEDAPVEHWTSATGHWTEFDAETGTRTLTASADGYYELVDVVDVLRTATWEHTTTLEPAARIPVRFEDRDGAAISLDPWGEAPARELGIFVARDVPGRTVDVGSKAANGGPLATLDRRSVFGDDLPSDLDERYQGLLTLLERPPLRVAATWRNQVLEVRDLSGAETELVFVVDQRSLDQLLGSVRVRIIESATGEPVTQNVALLVPNTTTEFESTVVDDALVFDGVPPGRHVLRVARRGHEWISRGVLVEAGTRTELGTIVLRDVAEFEVLVTNGDGEPVATTVTAARLLEPGERAPGERVRAIRSRVGADGVATFRRLAAGPTEFRAGGENGLARVGVVVDTRVTKTVELVLPPGVVTTFDWNGDLPSDGDVFVEDSSGTPFVTERVDSIVLAPGSYVLRVVTPDGELHRQPFQVGDEPGVVEVELAR